MVGLISMARGRGDPRSYRSDDFIQLAVQGRIDFAVGRLQKTTASSNRRIGYELNAFGILAGRGNGGLGSGEEGLVVFRMEVKDDVSGFDHIVFLESLNGPDSGVLDHAIQDENFVEQMVDLAIQCFSCHGEFLSDDYPNLPVT